MSVKLQFYKRTLIECSYSAQRLHMTWGCVMTLGQSHVDNVKVSRKSTFKIFVWTEALLFHKTEKLQTYLTQFGILGYFIKQRNYKHIQQDLEYCCLVSWFDHASSFGQDDTHIERHTILVWLFSLKQTSIRQLYSWLIECCIMILVQRHLKKCLFINLIVILEVYE